MEKDYEQLLEEFRSLKAEKEELQQKYNKLGEMYDELSLSYEDALLLYDRAKESFRMEGELRVARNIQMSMVPNQFPNLPELNLYAWMVPAKEVGGDLYDFFVLGRKLYFCVGDVSGKGVPASLFMAVTRVLFRHIAQQGLSPEEIAYKINTSVAQFNDSCMFVTMFIGCADLDTGRLDFCNCGHNLPIILEEGKEARFLSCENQNLPLGPFETFDFKGMTLDDFRDKQLLIYTDGLNEAENNSHEQFGDERVLSLMSTMWGTPPKEIIETLCEAVNKHRDTAEPNDDLTMMCLKITENK